MKELLKINPTEAKYSYDRGKCCMALRKFKDALHYADASVSLDPHKPHYYLLKVSLLLHFEDFNGAERAIAQAEKRCVNTKILNDAKDLIVLFKSHDGETGSCCGKKNSRRTALYLLRQRAEERERQKKADAQYSKLLRQKAQKDAMEKQIYNIQIIKVNDLPKTEKRKAIDYVGEIHFSRKKSMKIRKPSVLAPANLILKRWMIDEENGIHIDIASHPTEKIDFFGSHKINRYECSRRARNCDFLKFNLFNENHLPTGVTITMLFKIIDVSSACNIFLRNRQLNTMYKCFNQWRIVRRPKRLILRSILERTFLWYTEEYHQSATQGASSPIKVSNQINQIQNKSLQEIEMELQKIRKQEKMWYERFLNFYKVHNIEKANEEHILKLMKVNAGLEARAFKKLHGKYNVPLPADFFLEHVNHEKAVISRISQKKVREIVTKSNAAKGILDLLMPMDGFLKFLSDAKLEINSASSIFMKEVRQMWTAEREIKKSIAWSSGKKYVEDQRKPIGLNFRHFCRAILHIYITINKYPKKRLIFLYTKIAKKHIQKHCPLFENRRKTLSRSFIEDRWKQTHTVSLEQKAEEEHKLVFAVNKMQRNWRIVRQEKKARSVIKRFLHRVMQHEREAKERAYKMVELEDNLENEDESAGMQEESLPKRNLCLEALMRWLGFSRDDSIVENSDDSSDDSDSDEIEEGNQLNAIEGDLICKVDYIEIRSKSGIVYFENTILPEIRIGQQFVITGIEKGPTETSIKALNGTRNSFGKKRCYRIDSIDYLMNSITFLLFGRVIPQGQYKASSIKNQCSLIIHETMESEFYGNILILKQKRILREIAAENISNVVQKFREKWRKHHEHMKVTVNWKKQTNRSAFLNSFILRWWQFMAIALRFGPLQVEENSNIENIDVLKTTLNNTANVTVSNRTIIQNADQGNHEEMLNWRDFMNTHPFFKMLLVVIDIVTYIPQFQLPPSYGNTFPIFFGISIAISVIFPFYVKHALMRAKIGKLGVDDNGRILKATSKEGIYMAILNYINNNCYFGIMTTLFSSFACSYNREKETFYLLIDYTQSTTCFDANSIHSMYMGLAAIGIITFYPLATVLIPSFQFSDKALDIKFDKVFILVENQSDLIIIIIFVFLGNNSLLVLSVQLAICLFLALLCHHMHPCLAPEMNKYKTLVYLSAAYVTADAILFMYIPNVVIYIAMLAILPFVIIIYIKHHQNKWKKSPKVLPEEPIIDDKLQKEKKKSKKNISSNEKVHDQPIEEEVRPVELVRSNVTPDAPITVETERHEEGIRVVKDIVIYICPECRSEVNRKDWIKTNLENKCSVCMEDQRMFVSATCGHGVCENCLPKLKSKVVTNI